MLNVRVEACRKDGSHPLLDLDLLREHVNIAPPRAGFNFQISILTTGAHPWKKTLCAYVEPPIGPGYYAPYKQPQKFHTVYTFNPQNGQVEITTDPIVFPYAPNTAWDRKRKREKGSGMIYYAGNRSAPEIQEPDRFARHNFYGLRTRVVEDLMRRGAPVTAYGPGWPLGSTRLIGDFQHNKFGEMDACDADFVLCMENSQLENYISEKIHNGFQSGRVVCYLGEPLIHQRVPHEAFINLNYLCNAASKEFDHETLYLMLRDMSQTEYDRYLDAATEWRLSNLDERRDAQATALTSHMLWRMGCL